MRLGRKISHVEKKTRRRFVHFCAPRECRAIMYLRPLACATTEILIIHAAVPKSLFVSRAALLIAFVILEPTSSRCRRGGTRWTSARGTTIATTPTSVHFIHGGAGSRRVGRQTVHFRICKLTCRPAWHACRPSAWGHRPLPGPISRRDGAIVRYCACSHVHPAAATRQRWPIRRRRSDAECHEV